MESESLRSLICSLGAFLLLVGLGSCDNVEPKDTGPFSAVFTRWSTWMNEADEVTCNLDELFPVELPCDPDCAPTSCGLDGCGGVCSVCPAGQICVSGQCQDACTDVVSSLDEWQCDLASGKEEVVTVLDSCAYRWTLLRGALSDGGDGFFLVTEQDEWDLDCELESEAGVEGTQLLRSNLFVHHYVPGSVQEDNARCITSGERYDGPLRLDMAFTTNAESRSALAFVQTRQQGKRLVLLTFDSIEALNSQTLAPPDCDVPDEFAWAGEGIEQFAFPRIAPLTCSGQDYFLVLGNLESEADDRNRFWVGIAATEGSWIREPQIVELSDCGAEGCGSVGSVASFSDCVAAIVFGDRVYLVDISGESPASVFNTRGGEHNYDETAGHPSLQSGPVWESGSLGLLVHRATAHNDFDVQPFELICESSALARLEKGSCEPVRTSLRQISCAPSNGSEPSPQLALVRSTSAENSWVGSCVDPREPDGDAAPSMSFWATQWSGNMVTMPIRLSSESGPSGCDHPKTAVRPDGSIGLFWIHNSDEAQGCDTNPQGLCSQTPSTTTILVRIIEPVPTP